MEEPLSSFFVSRRTPTYETKTKQWGILWRTESTPTSTANWLALAPVLFRGAFGNLTVFQISYVFMPRRIAEPSLGHNVVKGNLFLRNRLSVYIRILTCSHTRQDNSRFKRERGEKELINRQMDRRTDYHANKGSGKQNREQNKCNEHSGKQET